ncbi:MAG: Rne/Rng family ribonuclease, partial [Kofleriaceae bacterium]|nr:Rne/Rng family ribonuclease [Kofleriaceae bacterium]
MRQIIINSTPQEARVALVDGSALLEIFIERTRAKGVAGNIYKGRVTRVLPGMQAAFVDIGIEKAAFLHASDLFGGSVSSAEEDVDAGVPAANGSNGAHKRPPIEEALRKDNEVVVQVAKEPIGGKGARVTAQIALAGRVLVYLPQATEIGVSRRIESQRERDRLREAVATLRPEKGGIIVRTSAEGLTKREIAADVRFLSRMWSRIATKAESVGAPALLHYDMDLILRVMRDFFTTDVHRVVVDNAKDHQRIVSFLDTVMPRLSSRVSLYEGVEPIFERFNLESQITRALQRIVRLKSGGYIAIDQTEALTAIDVNTGRYVGRSNPEETALETNLEAIRVIVEQLRLRNIGGLIIIDFIDMQKAAHRRRVFDALGESLSKDKARTNILSISPLGLVEMTRKRTRESLPEVLCSPCPHCEGTGRVKAVQTVAYEILRLLKREAVRNPEADRLTVTTRADVARFLAEAEKRGVEQLARETGKQIDIQASPE